MWNEGWENTFQKVEWGKYPPEELVRFLMQNYATRTDRKELSVLEVGCGPGANLWLVAREGFRAYGIDGSVTAIERARSHLAKDGLTAELTVGDVESLPYADETFDCVLDIECIYSNDVPATRKIMAEIKRVLKPGGLFFSKTFMDGTYEGALRSGNGYARFATEEQIRELYSPFELRGLDSIIRSAKNRQYEIKEWLVTCAKGKA